MWPAGGNCEKRGGKKKKQQFEWLLTPLQGHQLVDKLILWTLQGLEKKTTANPNVVLDFVTHS